ncbi:hypothetical protein EDB87DRAFT_1050139 [Lactarius vividus]|nr:hypothetical protein EDB87DRAFT_1050139 [Lactarius vividus]
MDRAVHRHEWSLLSEIHPLSPLSLTQPAFISHRDPARNQRPGSPLFTAQIDGPQVQRHYRGYQRAAYPLNRPPRFAPGINPCGNQKPGVPPPRHYQNRNRESYSPYPLPRRHDAGYQQDDLHPKTFQEWPSALGWPAPWTIENLGFMFNNWERESQVIALPQGSHINEVVPTPTRSATVPVPETNSPGFSLGTQPAGAPTPGTEAPLEEPQSTTGTCPDPACIHVSYARQQELERHVLKHLPHHLYCPHPGCSWRGDRRYSLVDHYKKQHPQDQLDLGSSYAFTIYDGKQLAKRIVNREVTLEQAKDRANALVRTKAVDLGKYAMWNIQYE